MTTPTPQELTIVALVMFVIIGAVIYLARWVGPLIVIGSVAWLVVVGLGVAYQVAGTGGLVLALFVGGGWVSVFIVMNMDKAEAKAVDFAAGLMAAKSPEMADTETKTMIETGNGFETYNRQMWKVTK